MISTKDGLINYVSEQILKNIINNIGIMLGCIDLQFITSIACFQRVYLMRVLTKNSLLNI